MKSKRISTNDVLPGMIVASDIYTNTNQLLLPKNHIINTRSITRLEFYSISNIDIFYNDESQNETQTYSEQIKSSPEFEKFYGNFVGSVDNIKDVFHDFVNKSTANIDTNQLLSEANSILSQSRNGIHVFHMLNCMRNFDDLTYVHSLNVSLICNVFGNRMKLGKKGIETLTLCGMMHDVGKLFIPNEIIEKPSTLTKAEFEIIKTHPMRGYEFLKGKQVDPIVSYSALMHHEKCDGSGYPHSLKGKQIHPFAKIVSIIDIYDAMTSARCYREALCPFEVIRVFENDGLQKYDPQYLLPFLETVVETYIHNHVQLSDGRTGEVVMINKQSLSRPVVQIEREFIDLSKTPDLTIINII